MIMLSPATVALLIGSGAVAVAIIIFVLAKLVSK